MKNINFITAILSLLLFQVFIALPVAADNRHGYTPLGADKQLTLNLFTVGAGNSETFNDAVQVRYNNGYLLSTIDDVVLINKASENISSYREGQDLSTEYRPFFSVTDTIFLHITNTGISNYRFKISTQNFGVTGLVVRLHDNYLNTSRVLNTYGGNTNHDFGVTADPASADPFRFMIVFITARPLPVTFNDFTAKQTPGLGALTTNIALQWQVSNQLNILQYEVERSANGTDFGRVAIQAAIATGGSHTYNWLDEQHSMVTPQQPLIHYYRIRCVGISGEISYSKTISIKVGKPIPGIHIYPNPVINNNIALQLHNIDKGMYQLRLFNSEGQVVFSKAVNYNGSNTLTVSPVSSIARGNYYLEITGGAGVKITKLVAK